MTRRPLLLLLVVAACARGDERPTDTVALPAIDTLKPAAVTDTLATRTDTPGTKTPATKTSGSTKATKAATKTTAPRDSAFPPPRNLPQLDTVKKKKPPV